ncbi:hypothetical protein BOTBODRAFT_37325 [Botryobasidium botryosum FD-172 SS1]|uniref:F-box domain-containing protein n=1 Tax=Botryobasidium botryosum (strain FD-172 SS1) TaxID=930990 RepID=A0A067M0K0_BOTB1|nr:hypothetical protein BOTBODRAFT_37325 [Botryobasidium botryosum FD-172 SS1]
MTILASLSSIPYDIIAVIAHSMVGSGSQRSLLHLALTSRKMHNLVVPEFLFACNSFLDMSIDTLMTFFQRVNAPGSTAGSAVRNFDYTSCHRLPPFHSMEFDRAMRKLQSLQSIKLWSLEVPRVPKEVLSSYRHLRSIRLMSCMPACLETFPDIWQLHVLSIQYGGGYAVTPDSALGKILIRSRPSLKELTLGHMQWCFEAPPADPAVPRFVWPNVHTLDFSTVRFQHLDFARTFPSTRNLISPEIRHGSDYRMIPCDASFFRQLESLEGYADMIHVALATGSKFRRIVQHHSCRDPDAVLDLGQLPSSLHSLHLVQTGTCLDHFAHLAGATPHLQVLSITFNVGYDHQAIPMLEKLLVPLAHLPLKHLSFNVGHGARSSGPAAKSEFLQSCQEFTQSALTFIPTLEALSVSCPNWNICWKRVGGCRDPHEDASRFKQVSWSVGCALKDRHDWDYQL